MKGGAVKETSFFQSSLGEKPRAEELARRAIQTVPAYRAFLARQNVPAAASFDGLPLMDKAGYILPSAYRDLLADDFDDTFFIFRSSGSSGHGFLWPQLKGHHRHVTASLRVFLETAFEIQQKRTLAIVGLALGSWIGGEHFSWVLKSLALDLPYPFAVFSPGNRHDEILDMMTAADSYTDQILLFLCPSAIAHLQLTARDRGVAVSWNKVRYVVLGEPIPEPVRQSLRQQAGVGPEETFMLSVYGSADTGTLGAESSASVFVRSLLSSHPALAESLGLPPPVPHFFHLAAPDIYLETVRGELCVTRWQGIPLVRYNLHDRAWLFDWKRLMQAVVESPLLPATLRETVRAVQARSTGLPDVVAVAGRADACLLLCGTNITEVMLDETIRCAELEDWLTGIYRAAIGYDQDRQHLRLQVELKRGVPSTPDLIDRLYPKLIQALGRVQPEFLDDWKNLYAVWDADPPRRILQVHAVEWPALSNAAPNQVKQRGMAS